MDCKNRLEILAEQYCKATNTPTGNNKCQYTDYSRRIIGCNERYFGCGYLDKDGKPTKQNV